MANAIRDYRKIMGWTQQELAEKLGVGRESVIRWENGDMPSINIADAMCMIFWCTLYDLFPDLQSSCHYRFNLEEQRNIGENASVNEFLAYLRSLDYLDYES